MSGRFASLHAGLLLRERQPARPAAPPVAPPSQPTAVGRPFPVVAPPAPVSKPAAERRRRSFTVRLDEAHHVLLQLAKMRFGLSGQRLLVLALEKLVGAGGR